MSPGLPAHMALLQSHWQRLPLQQLLPLAATALLTAACQRSSVDLGGGLAADGAAVAVAMCQAAVNGVAVVPPRVSSAADRRGQALYPLLSLLNHSCRPNVSVTFEVRLGAPLCTVQGQGAPPLPLLHPRVGLTWCTHPSPPMTVRVTVPGVQW